MIAPVPLRRPVALVGIVAILFQAILFGWHHHPLVLASQGARPDAVANNTVPLSPASAEDGCDICQALRNLSTSPVDFALLSVPASPASVLVLPALVLAGRGSERVFQARAPPRA